VLEAQGVVQGLWHLAPTIETCKKTGVNLGKYEEHWENEMSKPMVNGTCFKILRQPQIDVIPKKVYGISKD